MKKLSIVAILFILVGVGCSLIRSDTLGFSNKFRRVSSYSFSSFNLNGDYTYWEVRVRNRRAYQDTTIITTETILSYDENSYKRLPAKQRKSLKGITLDKGFARPHVGLNVVPPLNIYYAIAANADSIKVATSVKGLISLFGTIDTEAELHLLLWTRPYYTKLFSYKKVNNGYRVYVKKGGCAGSEKDIILITKKGKFKKLKTVSTKNLPVCIDRGIDDDKNPAL